MDGNSVPEMFRDGKEVESRESRQAWSWEQLELAGAGNTEERQGLRGYGVEGV